MIKKINQQEAEDILYGACILGAGGGGSLTEGLSLINQIYETGRTVRIVSVNDVEDDWLIVSPYYVGSAAPLTEEAKQKLSALSLKEGNPSVFATIALEQYLGRRAEGLCATELGGNTAWAMDVAANLDIPLIDGDPAGRAVPDLAHTSFNVHGASITPLALVNRYGEQLIVQRVASYERADQIARGFAIASGNFSGICDHPLEGKRFKEIVIPGTLGRAQIIGKARREALESKENPISALVDADNGRIITEGVVVHAAWKDVNGFIEGKVEIASRLSNKSYIVDFRNENMTVECEEKLIGIIPDIFTILDASTGLPILNPSCQEGMKVVLAKFTSPDIWTTPEGIAIFGPRYIGRKDQEYFETLFEEKERNESLLSISNSEVSDVT